MYSLRWLKVLAAPTPTPPPQTTRPRRNDSVLHWNAFIVSRVQWSYTHTHTPIPHKQSEQPANINQNRSNNKLIGFLCLPTKPIRCNDMTGLMAVYALYMWDAMKTFCAPSPKSTNLLLILIRPTYFSVIFTTDFVFGLGVCACVCVCRHFTITAKHCAPCTWQQNFWALSKLSTFFHSLDHHHHHQAPKIKLSQLKKLALNQANVAN